MIVLFSISQK